MSKFITVGQCKQLLAKKFEDMTISPEAGDNMLLLST